MKSKINKATNSRPLNLLKKFTNLIQGTVIDIDCGKCLKNKLLQNNVCTVFGWMNEKVFTD